MPRGSPAAPAVRASPTCASLEAGQRGRLEVVVAARLHRRHALAEARQRERVVAHGADVVLRLPEPAALDARARVERVDDAPAEEVLRGGRECGAPGLSRRAVSPNISRKRGPAGRKSAAGVSERSNCSASGNRKTR